MPFGGRREPTPLLDFGHDTDPLARCANVVELLVHDEQLRASVFDDVGDLLGREAVVGRQQDRAQVARGEEQIEEGRAVLHPKRDHIALPDAARREQPRGAKDAHVEGPPGDRLVVVPDRDPLGHRARVMSHECGEVHHRALEGDGSPATRQPNRPATR